MEVTHLLAPNPGRYTGPGTNTWILESDGAVLVVDPGPIIAVHADAIVDAIGDREVAGVLVTHTHPDHAPLANPLAGELGVAALGHAPGPEFEPDRRLDEGDAVDFGGETLTVLHTPGHATDHLCFVVGTEMFTGDHIMGGSTVMIEDLSAYLAQLRRLRDLTLTRLYPGHGPTISRPHEVIDHYIDHRLEREQQIVAAIEAGERRIVSFFSHVRVRYVSPAEIASVDPDLRSFRNVNTPTDWKTLQMEWMENTNPRFT